MKKLIFLLAMAMTTASVVAPPVKAQTTTYNAKIGDSTITNAGTPSYTLVVKGPKTNVSFEYVIAKTSGTIAGTIVLSGTLDGTNYATINTYTLTDASANTSLTYAYNGYIKYKVLVNVTTGTLVANFKVWALYR